jgi:hypothetical protein
MTHSVAPTATSADAPPPTASAAGVPKDEANQPANRAPTGVEPANTVV